VTVSNYSRESQTVWFAMFSNSATWKPWLDTWESAMFDTPLLEHLPVLKPNRSTPIHRMEFHLPTMAT
jgi:hypothetical protein